jgi:aminoglycoside phosphotransferase
MPPPILLTGHSGARLQLFASANPPFVRKRAADAARSARLRAQAAKISWAASHGIDVPAIIGDGEQDGVYYFDMEYMPAESASHAAIAGEHTDWPRVFGALAGLLRALRATEAGEIPAAAFAGKLRAIEAASVANGLSAPLAARLAPLIGSLAARDWRGIPSSACHGDLTLENILLGPGKRVTFIDFDVPEPSSWQLDIAKLFQDLTGQWCLRRLAIEQGDSIETTNAKASLGRLARAARTALLAEFPLAPERLTQMVCYHLLRTLPYARDEALAAFVLTRIETLLR